MMDTIFDTGHNLQSQEYYEDEFLVVNNEWKKKEKKSVEFYKQLIVPESMKSPYWEYFGFPADEDGNIISKEKVVCSICGNQISYCQNTTNLRSHLRNKHKVEYNNIQDKLTLKSPQSHQTQKFIVTKESPPHENYSVATTSQFKIKRKLKEEDSDKKFTFSIVDACQIDEPYQQDTSNQSNPLEGIQFEEVEDHQMEEAVVEPPTKIFKQELKSQQQSIKHVSILPQIKVKNPYYNADDITSNVLRMIFTDLLSLDFVEGNGFREFVNSFISHPYTIPSKASLTETIIKYYEKHINSFYTLVKQTVKDNYSICFEIWENCEQKSFLTISINVLDVSKFEINNFVIDVVEFNAPSEFDWDEFFKKHDYLNMLEKCFGCVMNFNDIYLRNYFSMREIPVIPCLVTLLERAMETTLSLEPVSNNIDIIFSTYLTSKDLLCMENNWMARWEKLVELREQLEQDANRFEPEVLQNCALIVDFLNPIQVGLELLPDLIPSATLIKPLLEQLLEKHLSVDTDGEMTLIMRQNINGIFAFETPSLKFLNIASFLDPRFNQSYDADSIHEVKTYIRDYFNKKNENSVPENVKKPEPDVKIKNENKMRKLSFIFNKDSPKPNLSSQAQRINSLSKVEAEFDKYMQEESIAIEMCPGKWWIDNGFVYKNLKKLADQYFSVSHSSHTRYKCTMKEQLSFMRKRSHLNDPITDKIVFIHYNKDIFEHMDST